MWINRAIGNPDFIDEAVGPVAVSAGVNTTSYSPPTGMPVADVEEWPERLKQITVDDIRAVARKYLVEKNSVTGILVPAPDQTSRGEQPVHVPHPGRS